jgi:hypothetical protein
MKPNALPNDVRPNESTVSAPACSPTFPLQVRAQVSGRLSTAERGGHNLEKVTSYPEFIGSVYRVNGRRYGLTEEGMAYDLQSHQFVDDIRIRDQVFDQHEEEEQTMVFIRSKAKALAKGDSCRE